MSDTHKEYYTVTEAAELLGMSYQTVRRMCSDGRLDGVIYATAKKVRMIPAAEVLKYLVPVEQVAEVEAANQKKWSDQRKANYIPRDTRPKNRPNSINTTLQK
jgi:excisionase family DNA binding protein